MTTIAQGLTLEEYLRYVEGTDARYELVKGALIPMSIGMGQHGEIADFLTMKLRTEIERMGEAWVSKQMVVGIQSPRAGRWDTVRIPDVVVLPLEQWRSLQNREAIVRLNEPPPLLIIEVVSDSTRSTDYRAKRAEYSVLDIPEYWIIDPPKGKVTILTLIEGWYEAREFFDRQASPQENRECLQSNLFPNLDLTVEQVVNGNL